MAIITRWRRPPLSWNEYSSMRRSGLGMPTMRSISMPCCARFLLAHVAVQANGLDDLVADGVEGAERGHRLLEDQGDFAAADVAHLPAVGVERGQVDLVHTGHRPGSRRSQISPSTMCPGSSTMRRIERAVTLLPQPLSPTMPSVLPA